MYRQMDTVDINSRVPVIVLIQISSLTLQFGALHIGGVPLGLKPQDFFLSVLSDFLS